MEKQKKQGKLIEEYMKKFEEQKKYVREHGQLPPQSVAKSRKETSIEKKEKESRRKLLQDIEKIEKRAIESRKQRQNQTYIKPETIVVNGLKIKGSEKLSRSQKIVNSIRGSFKSIGFGGKKIKRKTRKNH